MLEPKKYIKIFKHAPEGPGLESYKYIENVQISSKILPNILELWYVAWPSGLLPTLFKWCCTSPTPSSASHATKMVPQQGVLGSNHRIT